jgi:transcriptional activator SPT7
MGTNYFMNLGKTLQQYTETYGKTMDHEDILLHSLGLNGSNVASLEFYMRHDIQQYGSKLSDLSERLQVAYHDIDLVLSTLLNIMRFMG